MYEKPMSSENKNIFTPKIAQEVMNNKHENNIKTSCCVDTTKITSCDIKTSCCIDTTKE